MHANFLNLQAIFNSNKKFLHFIFFLYFIVSLMLTKFVNARIENTKRLPQVSAILQTFICWIIFWIDQENLDFLIGKPKWPKSPKKWTCHFHSSLFVLRITRGKSSWKSHFCFKFYDTSGMRSLILMNWGGRWRISSFKKNYVGFSSEKWASVFEMQSWLACWTKFLLIRNASVWLKKSYVS